MERKQGILSGVAGDMRRLAKPLFLVHIAWTALGFILLAPLVAGLTRLLLRIAGETAIADQDIVRFALRPLGLASILVVAAVVVAIVALEIASMMRVAMGAAHDAPASTLSALGFATSRLHGIVALALRMLVHVLLIALPFLAVGAGVAWFLLKDHDINYYLSRQPPAYWIAVVVVGALLLVLAILLVRKAIDWAFALPLLLFSGVPSRQALGASAGIARGRRGEILRALVGWALLALLFATLLVAGVRFLGSWILPSAPGSLGVAVLVLGLLALLFTLGNVVVSGFSAALFALGDYALFERHGPGVAADVLESARRSASTSGGRRLTGAGLVALLGLVAVAAVLAGGWLLEGVRVVDDVEIIAHRGAAGAAPENTRASMSRAIEDGTDWLELDVQETKDGRVVVIHDSDFMKLAGVDLKVWDADLEQARSIDVGSWFAPEFADERVPTLQEILELARGRVGVVIELKYYGHDQDLEQRVVDLVERTGMVADVKIMSLDQEGIQRVRALRPAWPIGLLTATALGDLTRRDADFLAVNLGMATASFIQRAHRRGKDVYVWTVNDAVTMSRVISLGVDGLITDEPALARRVLAERADMSTIERLLLHAAVLFDLDVPAGRSRDDASP